MTERKHQPPDAPVRPRLPRVRKYGLAIVAAAVAGCFAIIGLNETAGDRSRYAIVEDALPPGPVPVDPLRGELIRCRGLPANADDARCRAAWEINRRRFLGESRSLILPPAGFGSGQGEP